ncbi:serine/threonine-protein kinase RsbW [Prauserella shujinwangii]|uniref:Serine/threonine-protein kinase RsbW n=1 Tax=Prauserella shujinwangii TaxID=1453103 RepID=A0A2T0LX65_9PSEU|nr:ATP-binding protein [Prauserella shujinwangii]PRX48614.1 serine/threonine-protein kinase RsbW [Prauserella shujinwangii]
MREPELAEWIGYRSAGPVELRLPAQARQLSLLRTVAHQVALGAGFDRDEVADIKLAVDEACTCLISRSVPGAMLSCRYITTPEAVRVTVSTTTREGTLPSQEAFGWQVLRTLTDSLAAWRDEQNGHRAADRAVHIVFAKLRHVSVH